MAVLRPGLYVAPYRPAGTSLKAAALDTSNLSFQDIAVLDLAPNDITVVQGLITAEWMQAYLKNEAELLRERAVLLEAIAEHRIDSDAQQLVDLVAKIS